MCVYDGQQYISTVDLFTEGEGDIHAGMWTMGDIAEKMYTLINPEPSLYPLTINENEYNLSFRYKFYFMEKIGDTRVPFYNMNEIADAHLYICAYLGEGDPVTALGGTMDELFDNNVPIQVLAEVSLDLNNNFGSEWIEFTIPDYVEILPTTDLPLFVAPSRNVNSNENVALNIRIDDIMLNNNKFHFGNEIICPTYLCPLPDEGTFSLTDFSIYDETLVESINTLWEISDGYSSENVSFNHGFNNHVFKIDYVVNLSRTYTIDINNSYYYCQVDTSEIVQVYPKPILTATALNENTYNFSFTSFEDIISWELDFGDGNTIGGNESTGQDWPHTYDTPGNYTITLTYNYGDESVGYISCSNSVQIRTDIPDCASSFSPCPDKDYILSAWVKQQEGLVPVMSYEYPQIQITFTLNNQTELILDPFVAKGKIVDGWQQISEKVNIPSNATDIKIDLLNTSPTSLDCFFDDIRFFPFNGNLKSFVFDGHNLKLTGQHDENNYTSFWEYDKEGKLNRVKKETERGIMTIKESRTNIIKRDK